MREPRVPHELETRSNTERPKSWAPPALLPDPAPEEGYVFRWIRISTFNDKDPSNISAKFREGWEPVRADTQPHMAMLSTGDGRFKDMIEVGGLLLCKTAKELMEQRAAYYDGQANAQMTSVESQYKSQSDPRMPVFVERKSSVSSRRFGTGN